MFELLITTKKELQIEETHLFKSSKIFNISNGVPNDFDIRTFKYHLLKIDLGEIEVFHKFITK